MAETLAFYVRLLVVQCLVFVVVQAETMARGSLGGTEWIQSNAMKLRRECGYSGVRLRCTE